MFDSRNFTFLILKTRRIPRFSLHLLTYDPYTTFKYSITISLFHNISLPLIILQKTTPNYLYTRNKFHSTPMKFDPSIDITRNILRIVRRFLNNSKKDPHRFQKFSSKISRKMDLVSRLTRLCPNNVGET